MTKPSKTSPTKQPQMIDPQDPSLQAMLRHLRKNSSNGAQMVDLLDRLIPSKVQPLRARPSTETTPDPSTDS